jgi:DNA-binding CsgD family transcriptional regulator
VLHGQARLAVRDYAGAMPSLRRAFAAYDPLTAQISDLPWILRASQVAFDVWDLDALRTLSQAAVDLARAGGVLAALPGALNLRSVALLQDGNLDAAALHADEIDVIKQVTRQPFPANVPVVMSAWRGRPEPARQFIAAARQGGVARREGLALSIADFAEAILNNALGQHAEAFVAGVRQLPHAGELRVTMRAMTELVEAAVHVGEQDIAEQALAQLQLIREPFGGFWLGGEHALASALVMGDDDAAERHYVAAIEQLDRGELYLLGARARLCFGEWLRRRRRRIDAREQLTAAHARFAARGAEAFAARAARELAATGAKARPRIPGSRDTLTVQERTVARLARDGHTNREIATRLFLSDRTVEYHLRKVYGKLGISSRRALAEALPAGE